MFKSRTITQEDGSSTHNPEAFNAITNEIFELCNQKDIPFQGGVDDDFIITLRSFEFAVQRTPENDGYEAVNFYRKGYCSSFYTITLLADKDFRFVSILIDGHVKQDEDDLILLNEIRDGINSGVKVEKY